MDEHRRTAAIDALEELGSVSQEGKERYGPVREVDLGRGGTEVTDDVLDHLRCLPELKNLYVDLTSVTDRIMDVVQLCPRLQVLHVENTYVTDRGLEQLKHARALEQLLIGCDYDRWPQAITDEGFAHVRWATQLTKLNLSYTQVTGKGMASIKDLRNLSTLTLSPRQLDEDGVLVLKGLPNLATVYLTAGYPVEHPLIDLEPIANALRHALPTVKVLY